RHRAADRREEVRLMQPAAATAALSNDQRIAALRLIRTDNVGPATFRQLVNRFGSAQAALEALPELSARAGKPARVCSHAAAEDEIAGAAKYGARIVLGA